MSPALAFGPLPLTMSSLASLRGGAPVGFAITGLTLVSLSASRSADGLGSSVVLGVGLRALGGRVVAVVAAAGPQREE